MLLDPSLRLVRQFVFRLWRHYCRQRNKDKKRWETKNLSKWFTLWLLNMRRQIKEREAKSSSSSESEDEGGKDPAGIDKNASWANWANEGQDSPASPVSRRESSMRHHHNHHTKYDAGEEVIVMVKGEDGKTKCKVLPGELLEKVSEGKWRVKTVQGGNEAGMEVTVDEKDMALRTKEGICKLIKRTDDPDEVRM